MLYMSIRSIQRDKNIKTIIKAIKSIDRYANV